MKNWKEIKAKLLKMNDRYVAIDILHDREDVEEAMHIAKINVMGDVVWIINSNGIMVTFEEFVEKYPYCKFYYCDVKTEI